jgi:hypothetical protein
MDSDNRLTSPPSSKERSQSDIAGEEHQVVDVLMLATALWRGKYFILLCTAIGLTLGIRNLTNYAPVYEAKMVVSPLGGIQTSSRLGSSGIQGIAKISGLSELLGKTGEATVFDRLRYAIGSINLVQKLDKNEDIIRRTSPDSWDSEKSVWIRPTGLRFETEQKIKAALHLRLWQHPTAESFAEFLKSAIEIKEEKDAPFYSITYRHADREKAGQFLQKIFYAADVFLRDQDRLRALEKKAYLEKRLEEVSLQDHKMLMLSLLAQTEQRLMLLQSELTYSANIIEPVFVASAPTSPNFLKDVGVVVMAWFLASIGITIVFFLIKLS